MTSEPPPIAGVRPSFVEARDVRFHVTDAGPPTDATFWHYTAGRNTTGCAATCSQTSRPGCASSRPTCPDTAGMGEADRAG